jgi:hypothetical protein
LYRTISWILTVSGSNRVNRGGNWGNDARNCRSAYRNTWNDPGNRNRNSGLRLLSTSDRQRVWFTDHARVHKALSRSGSRAGLPVRWYQIGQIAPRRSVW